MINNENRIEEFLSSNEFKAWQKSFVDFLDYFQDILDKKIDNDQKEKLRRDLVNNHLFASIRLGSAYSKEYKKNIK